MPMSALMASACSMTCTPGLYVTLAEPDAPGLRGASKEERPPTGAETPSGLRLHPARKPAAIELAATKTSVCRIGVLGGLSLDTEFPARSDTPRPIFFCSPARMK